VLLAPWRVFAAQLKSPSGLPHGAGYRRSVSVCLSQEWPNFMDYAPSSAVVCQIRCYRRMDGGEASRRAIRIPA
jgi:hypothetical protein